MAPISASGCSTPISLLAAITETRTVRSVIAASQLVEVDEALGVDAKPRHPAAFALEALARVEHRLVLGRHGDDVIAAIAQRVRRRPLMARLFDSVAPLVKTISCADAPMSAATC